MILVARSGAPFSLRRALAWAVTWAIGAGIGVALGGWLTLIGGSGAPGVEALNPWSDLVLLPLAAFAVVLVVHLVGQLVSAVVRGRRAGQGGEDERDEPQSEGDSVTG